MSQQTDRNTPIYSSVLDQIIILGRNDLFYPGQPLLEEENEFCGCSIAAHQNSCGDLSQGFELLKLEIEKAMILLEGLGPFSITPMTSLFAGDDGSLEPIDIALSTAMRTLDDLIYLDHAYAILPILTQERYVEHQNSVFDLILSLADRMLPFWKLVPVNEQRRQILAGIPDDYRALFPWYQEWSDLPEDALSIVAEVLAGKSSAWRDVYWLTELQAEVAADPVYLMYLENLTFMFRELPQAFASAHALAWDYYAELEASEHVLPDGVYAKEGLYLSRELIVEEILQGHPSVEWRFHAASCAVGLSRKDRMALFKEIEKTIDEESFNVPDSVFGGAMKSWLAGVIDVEELISRIHNEWWERFEQKAAVTERLTCSRENFLEFLYAEDVISRAKMLGKRGGEQNLLNVPLAPNSAYLADFIIRLREIIPSIVVLPEAATLGQSFLRTVFPDSYYDVFSLAAADSSCDVDCQYINAALKTPSPIYWLCVKLDNRGYIDGRLSFTGRIDFDPNHPYPENQICGLLAGDDQLYCAESFSLDPEEFTFKAEFLVDSDIKGRLRIILIHRGC